LVDRGRKGLSGVAEEVKPPASTLIVDAAILIAAALGKTSGAVSATSRAALLLTTDRAVIEARRRIELGLKQPSVLMLLDDLVAEMTVVPVAALVPLLPESDLALRDSVPSHNGSTRDAHLLALARSVDADIWTHDRDFSGTGVATWSTTNLMRGLAL
jgi:predicted nucleic acid-binding protein